MEHFSNALIETNGWTYTNAVLPGTVASVAYSVAMVLFRFYQGTFAFLIGCIIDGWHYGMIMALVPVLTAKLFGSKYCEQNYGVISFLGLLSTLIGSQLTGYLVDTFQNYQASYLVCAAYLLLCLFFVFRLPGKHHRKPDTISES